MIFKIENDKPDKKLLSLVFYFTKTIFQNYLFNFLLSITDYFKNYDLFKKSHL